MWFCHRRQKDRKATPVVVKNEVALTPVQFEEGVEQIPVPDVRHHDHGLVSVLRPIGHVDSPRFVAQEHGLMAFPRMMELPAMDSSSYLESHRTIQDLRVVAFVERQLGAPLREDGPILGMEFDSPPPGAFGGRLGKLGFLIAIHVSIVLLYLLLRTYKRVQRKFKKHFIPCIYKLM
jgi:hypothetical protein